MRLAGHARAARRARAPPRSRRRTRCRPGMPSSRATRRAVSKAVWLPTVTTSSMTERSRIVGHEAGADALDLVRAGLAARQDRRILRLDRDDLRDGLARLQHLADAGDGAAGADAGDEIVDLAVGVVPDLLGRGAAVDLRVGRVLELLRDDRVRRSRPCSSSALAIGAPHALRRRASARARRRGGPASCAARSTWSPA